MTSIKVGKATLVLHKRSRQDSIDKPYITQRVRLLAYCFGTRGPVGQLRGTAASVIC